MYIGHGAAIWTTVLVYDLLNLYQATLSSAPASSIYNASSLDRLSPRAFAEAIAEAAGHQIWPKSVGLIRRRQILENSQKWP